MNIAFTTFNARYSHTALALRCLRANLGDLHDCSMIIEFDNNLPAQTAVEKLLAHNPQIILFSVYIWNLTMIEETVTILRHIRPDIKLVIGGPEVSYEYEDLPLFKMADHLIRGEGESVIEQTCRDLLDGKTLPKVIESRPANLNRIQLPYDEYTDTDIAHRRIYVETSRGCPFKCAYCLSSIEPGVRFFPLEKLLPMLKKLIDRGARTFKLIDRSFNINPDHAAKVLRFFLENRCEGMMLHLEWEPEQLQEELQALIESAPAGFMQLEVGVQTFNPEVAQRIERQLSIETIERHIALLNACASTHLHSDLIAGLPGETLESIAAGFDRLHACGPEEIQLGILKKLRGAPIAKHDTEWQMVYNTLPPYDVLQTSTLSFVDLQRLRRFARLWNITVNNGRFPNTAPLIWQNQPSVFDSFLEWSDWVCEQTNATAGIAPGRLSRLLRQFLVENRHLDTARILAAIETDLSPAAGPVEKGRERQSRHAGNQ